MDQDEIAAEEAVAAPADPARPRARARDFGGGTSGVAAFTGAGFDGIIAAIRPPPKSTTSSSSPAAAATAAATPRTPSGLVLTALRPRLQSAWRTTAIMTGLIPYSAPPACGSLPNLT